MFWQEFKYNFLITLRDKTIIWWTLIFVMLLGTLFQLTFGGAVEKDEFFSDIPVAVCIEDEQVKEAFDSMIATISLDDNSNSKLLKITYVDSMEEGKKLLGDKKVNGIFYSEGQLLKVMVDNDGIKEGILTNVAVNYHQIVTVMTAIVEKSADEKTMMLSMLGLMGERTNNTEITYTKSKMDPFVDYFYNLIAMGSLFACFAGLNLVLRTQANLSTVGARRCVAQHSTFGSTIAGLLANLVLLATCEFLAMGYLTLIGVNFGHKIPQMILVVIVAVWTGLCLGFFVGSFGKLSAAAKNGLCVGVSLGCCFMSGLMIMDLKPLLIDRAPWVNKVNPAALISDSFYALNVYDSGMTFWYNILTLVLMSIVMIGIGCMVGRRKRYASI